MISKENYKNWIMFLTMMIDDRDIQARIANFIFKINTDAEYKKNIERYIFSSTNELVKVPPVILKFLNEFDCKYM